MKNEGFIKFRCVWKKTKPVHFAERKNLNFWRCKLRRMGLIGVDRNGIGFGNMSVRITSGGKFMITGTQTARLSNLTAKNFTRVTGYNFRKNQVACEGPAKASSESMTHAAIYRTAKKANAVIHVHCLKLWKKLLNRAPTSNEHAAYGTPEMAKDVFRLLRETDLRERKIMVMGGHREGVVAFGRNIEEAANTLLDLLD